MSNVDRSVLMAELLRALRRFMIEQIFSKYSIDLNGFKFNREEANARN